MRDGHIDIELTEDETQCRVTVRDSGVGMSPEVMQHVFDKFYQGDESRSSEGNGLGLSLVKRIVSLHGGKVEVASEMGKGSAFAVVLPKVQA